MKAHRSLMIAAACCTLVLAACGDTRSPPTPRSDATGINSPGPVVDRSAARTDARPADTPPATVTATPGLSGSAAAGTATPDSRGSDSASTLPSEHRAQAMPMPKQNNDHSIPATVRAPVGEGGSVAADPYGAPRAPGS